MERALLVTVDFKKRGITWTAEERSQELSELARSARAVPTIQEIVHRDAPDSAHFIGSGKAQELGERARAEKINVVIFNNDLTGTQQKNLEDIIGVKIVDRTQLILDIFARRARSNEGKIQVELAQLLYLLPRLTGKGIMLSRLGGGIGTSGPGEQKLEVDRRRIRDRVARLRRELEDLRTRRSMMRKHRKRFASLSVAIVGYTNVGKSTLLNALTDAQVVTQDKLFSTLDPTVRQLTLPSNQKALFIDTVGFLNGLPVHLIEAFKATLEEVIESDLILHLIDASHPKREEQAAAVIRILHEIGITDTPIIQVLNKIDVVPPEALGRIQGAFGQPEAISALKRTGLEPLIGRITAYVAGLMTHLTVLIPADRMKVLNIIYENGTVTQKASRADGVYVEADVPARVKELVEELLGNPKKT